MKELLKKFENKTPEIALKTISLKKINSEGQTIFTTFKRYYLNEQKNSDEY